MTPNSDFQFMYKESGNSMTTAKLQSARLLPLWRPSNIISTKNNDRTNITIIMIAIVHSIYSQSVHAPARDAGLMDNDAERYCTPRTTLNDHLNSI